MSVPPQVLVFDSGVGALSIIQALRRRLPHIAITYVSDNGFFPYGTKGEAELIDRVENLFEQLIARYQPIIAVIACNTASTIALPALRARFSLPFVGVVPAIKPAAEQSKTRVIGLIATPATVARPYTHELIKTYAADCRILSLGSTKLVELAEQKVRGQSPTPESIHQAIEPLLAQPHIGEMDTIVLACTHFPLLKAELQPHFSPDINWLDSGNAIANRVASLLAVDNLESAAAPLDPPPFCSVFTQDTATARQLAEHLPQYLPGGTIDYIKVQSS